MPQARLPRLLRDLLNLPTATFREDAVLDYVKCACGRLKGVSCKSDKYGNLLARYRHRPRKVTPLVFAAHTDHPGFVARKMIAAKRLRADFRGGVRPEFFAGTRVCFWTADGLVRGKVLEICRAEKPAPRSPVSLPKEVIIQVSAPIEPETIGMWDLPDARLKGDNVFARGCDDIAGCAAMLALLERLSRKQAAAETYCLFSRAEELGFIGAIAAARALTVPKRLPIVAIETSSELPNARIGDGPILRVGDRVAVYTPPLTAFCDRVAKDLTSRRRAFKHQRKLMDGGTCESTAYMAYGYEATGICVALGNYHNMNRKRGRIDSEYISLADYSNMVAWFEALVMDKTGYTGGDTDLRGRLDTRFERFEQQLL